MNSLRRVLILYSNTGGGHRSAAEAIVEALETTYPGAYAPNLVDVFRDYAPEPVDRLPAAYPVMTRLPAAWGLGFKISNGRRRARALTGASWPYVRRSVSRLVSEQPAEVIVSVHPLLIDPVIRALGSPRPPFLTVVTDLVSTHALWFHRQVDLCVVPTPAARVRAMQFGLRPDQVRVVGLPVARRFSQPHGDPARLRQMLGWPEDRPVVLLTGGGEGMGPILETARAIAGSPGRFALAVVAGRNRRLQAKLEASTWPVQTFVYGFERRMAEMMRAARLLVTKAGPQTIAEALNAGLPMVLYSHVPGQEDGNVTYVVEEQVGLWAPGPERSAQAVAAWLAQPEDLNRAAKTCRRLARPLAATEVAALIDAAAARGDGTRETTPPRRITTGG
jgi:1,2-diacylglycerol 3-beta-galactosyltransferase